MKVRESPTPNFYQIYCIRAGRLLGQIGKKSLKDKNNLNEILIGFFLKVNGDFLFLDVQTSLVNPLELRSRADSSLFASNSYSSFYDHMSCVLFFSFTELL